MSNESPMKLPNDQENKTYSFERGSETEGKSIGNFPKEKDVEQPKEKGTSLETNSEKLKAKPDTEQQDFSNEKRT